MTPQILLNHFKALSHWVNWEKGADAIRFGDPDKAIFRIGTGWSACLANLTAAAEDKCDLFISHENPGLDSDKDSKILFSYNERRKAVMEQAQMTLMNLHDTWDHWPGYGIRDGFAKLLGFGEPVLELDYIHPGKSEVTTGGRSIGLYSIEPVTLGMFCQTALERMKKTGERCLKLFGDPEQIIKTVAIGVGCHIPAHQALEAGADVLIMVYDRAMQLGVRIPLEESGANVIVIEHSTAESWAMETMKEYIEKQYPDLKCAYYANEPTYRVYI